MAEPKIPDKTVRKLLRAARALIKENEVVAKNSYTDPSEPKKWRDEWERADEQNFEAVAELTTWCDAVETMLRG